MCCFIIFMSDQSELMDTQWVSIVQYVATYLCSYVVLALVFLLRCSLIASWFPNATQPPKVDHASRVCGHAPRKS